MQNVKYDKALDDTSSFFDDTLTNIDLNLDMQDIYKFMDDDKIKNKLEEESNLTNLRNENYKRYTAINILKYRDLPEDFSGNSNEIISLYDSININNLLNDTYENSNNIRTILNNIDRKIFILDNMIKTYLKELIKQNDMGQKKFSLVYFNNLNINDKLKKELINKYNDLVLQSSLVTDNIYEELKLQTKRKSYIDEISYLLNIEEKNSTDSLMSDRLKALNIVINIKIDKYNDKIHYLEDLIPESSKYTEDLNEFKTFYNKIIAYDDTSYEVAKQTFDILNGDVLTNRIKNLEEIFIKDREDTKREEKFIYEKVGIKNLKISLQYININYLNKLNEENKNIINYIEEKLKEESYDIEELNKALKLVVRSIWKEQITDVHSFNPNDDYYFICSNNQFIDPKYETILITKKEIERVDNYENYQIGFICSYNNNILYITENDDIMSVDKDDMSNLKTPLQLEQEFINFKICNRIALNGYITNVEAVYFIDDGNMDKYITAVELANTYKLPLIKLKKNN